MLAWLGLGVFVHMCACACHMITNSCISKHAWNTQITQLLTHTCSHTLRHTLILYLHVMLSWSKLRLHHQSLFRKTPACSFDLILSYKILHIPFNSSILMFDDTRDITSDDSLKAHVGWIYDTMGAKNNHRCWRAIANVTFCKIGLPFYCSFDWQV